MSQFDQLFALQLPSMRDSAFGTPGCTYTAPDGSAPVTGLAVQIQRDPPREVDRSVRAQGDLQSADITVLQSDLANCVKGGRFAVPTAAGGGPEVWTIEAVPLIEHGRFVCRCTLAAPDRIMGRRQKT